MLDAQLGVLESVPAFVAFIWGAAVGSFLNVVIWRLPRRKSLSRPASHCPRCGHALGLVDNIPIASYIMLRGKCRHCGVRISPRYMIIEIINGALWFAIVYHFYQLNPWPQNLLMFWLNTVAYLVFTSALLAALAIDLESYIIPDELNNFALFTGITLDLVGIVARDPMHTPLWGWLPRSIAGAVVCAGIFVFIQLFGLLLFRKDAMGDGDVKLARAIGAMLPLGLAVTSFVLAIALGAVIGGSLIAISGFLPKKPEKKAVNSSDQPESESILELSSNAPISVEEAEAGAGLEEMNSFEQAETSEAQPVEEPYVEATSVKEADQDVEPGDQKEEDYEPTPLPEALKIGLAYLTFTDVILYSAASLGVKSAIEPAKSWGWQTDESIEDDDFEPSLTTIPFGPYMVGGVIVALFYGQALIDWYLRFSGLGPKP